MLRLFTHRWLWPALCCNNLTFLIVPLEPPKPLMNRRHFLLSSLGTTLALPSMSSLMAKSVGGSVQVAKGAGMGAQRR